MELARNNYHGACVDFEVPEVRDRCMHTKAKADTTQDQFSWPGMWKDRTLTTNYLNYQEMRAYFDHVAKVLDIKKDCAFESIVVDPQFNEHERRWTVETADGRTPNLNIPIREEAVDRRGTK